MSYKTYKNKVQAIKRLNSIKDKILRVILRILSLLLFPVWISIFLINKAIVTIDFLINKAIVTIKYHSKTISDNKLTENRDIKKDKNFKKNMEIIYNSLLYSKSYRENSCIYISSDKIEDHLHYSLLGDVVDDSYNEMNLKTIYKNYPNKETYSTKEVIQMILEELINDNSLSVRWISSIKDLDIERDLSRVATSFDYDIINRMLDKVVLYRVAERK